MSEMPAPAPTAAALATVRRQLGVCAAFGAVAAPEQLDEIAERLTEVLRGYAVADTRRYPGLRRPLRPRSARTVHPWRIDHTPSDPEHPFS
ncbi:hypothetical protein FEK33_17345 [Nocardia asteroides NBRC 15531]|uniref:Uncharacterized protein n=1 Tax=Nocardia asteroides NBRC 15531 TaxID=1110697 RepID=U5EAF6_NOCAS|nr:DUF6374 family protein [Nocardia asteroides]TLF67676.1 hypothetical protein FEK33_17345 [Nocardia asteroides NBRC 15531]UGT50762.1 DUF6374 family protein [Nocardia asteroides]GAD83416.1 hypothetical protein NCAST_19_01170 [Nocardia asteroides NBRC 15531]